MPAHAYRLVGQACTVYDPEKLSIDAEILFGGYYLEAEPFWLMKSRGGSPFMCLYVDEF